MPVINLERSVRSATARQRHSFKSRLSRKDTDAVHIPALVLLTAIVLVFAFVVTGCGQATTQVPVTAGPSPTAAPPTSTSAPPLLGTLTVSSSGCNLELAKDAVAPGAYAIDIVNKSAAPYATFDMWTILPEQTYEGFAEQIEEARLMTESQQELSLASLGAPQGVDDWRRIGVGGPSETIYLYLLAGTYAIVCQEFIDPAGWWPMYIVGPIEVE